MTSDDFLTIFADDNLPPSKVENLLPPWKIAIVDDDQSVLDVTRLALKDIQIEGRALIFLTASSAAAGYELLKAHPDTAVILLDVVMETQDAGLQLVNSIRSDLQNSMLQIILRTGQAGYAPEEDVIRRYEINAYKTKSELTRTKLFTTIATAIRSYKHLQMVHESKKGLRAVIDASAQMLCERSVKAFSAGVLQQIDALFGMISHSFFCVSRRPSAGPFSLKHGVEGYVVVAANAQFSEWYGKDVEDLDQRLEAIALVWETLRTRQHQFSGVLSCLYLHTPSGWEGVVVAQRSAPLQQADPELLQVFCMNVALGLENAKYFSFLNQAAFKDELTGRFNRAGFVEEAGKAACHLPLHVFVIDIDYFHHMVESLGYDTGNAILKKLAAVLTEFFGASALIARLHADVFAVASPDLTLQANLVALRCAKPILVESQSIRLGLTVGQSTTDRLMQATQFEQVLRQAEIALKVAKEHKRGAGQLFEHNFELESRRNMTLLSDLRQAIERHELYLVLQPKVHIQQNQIVGYEALLRWSHPTKGLIHPGAFIPIVEKAGLNYDLDLYVAHKLCDLLIDTANPQRPIAFNISANSLHHDGFVDELMAIFSQRKIDLQHIQIEVTENALIQSEQAIMALRRLYQAGYTICLDDFGAGYSSLSYLLRLPLHIIKIDRAFVADLTVNGDSQKILYGMLAIIESVGKEVVIEGVETAEQLQMLKDLGVKIVQGYHFFYPALPQEAFEQVYPLIP